MVLISHIPVNFFLSWWESTIFLFHFLGEPVNGIENRLDHCSVSVSPSLNPDHEQVHTIQSNAAS
jgi:hypothetical protein